MHANTPIRAVLQDAQIFGMTPTHRRIIRRIAGDNLRRRVIVTDEELNKESDEIIFNIITSLVIATKA